MSGPVVLKIGGRALEEQLGQDALWAAMHSIHRARGLVLLHGGGAAVDRQLARLGMVTERREGIRITPPEQLEQIVGVLAGITNKQLVGCLNRVGAKAVGLCLGDGGMLETRKSTRYGFDPGRVGEVVGGDGSLISTLLGAGFLPIVCSIGIDAAGGFLNINADDAAAGLARAVRASAVALLTDVEGIRASGGFLAEVTREQIEMLIAEGSISGWMIVKARAAAETAAACGAPVVILSGETPAPLEAWAAGRAVGTRVVASAP